MGRLWYTDSSGKRHRTKLGNKMEYEHFQSSAKAKAERASRNSARREALKKGRVSKGDGKVLDHRNSNPMDNRPSNLRVISKSTNAGKREDSRLKGSKRSARRRQR